MRLTAVFFLFIIAFPGFSQKGKATLEDNIYAAVDAFVAHPTPENLEVLAAREKTFHPKTKPELLASVILSCNKAYYQNSFGQTAQAISSYEKAWQLFGQNKLSGYDIVESCLQPLGNLYTITGDYDNAENTIKQYFYIAGSTHNQPQKFAAILNLSNVYQNTGRQQEAIRLLEKTISTEPLSLLQKGLIWNNLGNNYLAEGNTTIAGKCYTTSIGFLEKEEGQAETLSNSYRNAALLNNDLQLFEKARKLFFGGGSKEPRKVAAFYRDEATLFFQKGQLKEAERAIRKAFGVLLPDYNPKKSNLPNHTSLYAEPLLLDALDLQAQFFLMLHQPQKALESYQLAFRVENLLQSALLYENSKIVNQARNRSRTEKCLAIYYSLYRKDKKTSDAETAFLLAEQTKSAVLRQWLTDSEKQSREEKRMVRQLQNWNTVIVKEQQQLEKADISKINEAIKKQNELMLLLKTLPGHRYGPKQELDMAGLYERLEKDDAVMAEYFFGKEAVYVFILEGGHCRMECLATVADTVSKLTRFIALFSNADVIANDPSAYNKLAATAYSVLKLPKKGQQQNLIIIPDGILNFLPFEALVTQKTATSNFAKMHYLLHDFKVGYGNSAHFYANTLPFHYKDENVLGIFPIFENTPLQLSFSRKELENLKTNYGGQYLEREKATFGNFKSAGRRYSILHLSTHASAGDLYEPANIRFYEREVLYSELYHLDIHPDLVVLSACETGLGKLYKAEGAMSVARGFQFAGAQNLLFSLWKVNDYTTSVLMEKFYAHVKSGQSYFEANHQAKLDFLADTAISNTKKSPYYWSAFVYYGSLENKTTHHHGLWIILAVGVTGLFLFLKFYRKKDKTSRPL